MPLTFTRTDDIEAVRRSLRPLEVSLSACEPVEELTIDLPESVSGKAVEKTPMRYFQIAA